MKRWCGLLLGSALLAAPSSSAWGAPSGSLTVAVMPVDGGGDLPEASRNELQARVHADLEHGDFEIVEVKPADGAEACTDPECWKAVAEANVATHVLSLRITVKDPDYLAEGELIDGATGDQVATVNDTCDLCGMDDVGAMVADLTGKLRRRVQRATPLLPTLAVSTRPVGAEVLLDGKSIGTTPVEVTADAGPHQIEIRRKGYRSEKRSLGLVEGVREQVSLELVPLAGDGGPAPDKGPSRWMRPVGATSLGAGIVALGAGIALIAVHANPIESDCDGENQDMSGRCKYLRDTQGGGIALTVAGVALAGAGIALLVVDGKRRRKSKAAARLGPTSVGLEVRF